MEKKEESKTTPSILAQAMGRKLQNICNGKDNGKGTGEYTEPRFVHFKLLIPVKQMEGDEEWTVAHTSLVIW